MYTSFWLKYNITLNVSDFNGLWDTDNVEIHVNDTLNPIAIAGQDITIEATGKLHCNASSSTDNVGIVNYTWTFIDGNIHTLYGVNVYYIFNNTGTYTITLNVTDKMELWDVDSFQVIVKENLPPIKGIMSF